jgi:hypothetical protein
MATGYSDLRGNAPLFIITCRHAAPADPQPPYGKQTQIVRQTFFTSAAPAGNKSIAFAISMCQYIFENQEYFR